MHARLGSLTPEQAAAVEALTRGLVNKFLHPPMQALKQAARENDSDRVEALCDVWSLPATPQNEVSAPVPASAEPAAEPEKAVATQEHEASTVGGK